MEGLLRLLIVYLTDTLKFLAKITSALALCLMVIHQLPQIHRTESAIIIAAKQSPSFQISLGDALRRPASIKSAGFAPADEPAEWLQKFIERIQRAREEVRQKALLHLRRQTAKEAPENQAWSRPTASQHERTLQPRSRAQTPHSPTSRFRSRRRPIEEGIASFYGKRWNGRKTANGEIFNDEKYTAAHKTLPFGTFVRVVRKDNGRSVVVRINDRGPFKPGRIIDLSTAGARRLGMLEEGLVEVALYPATLVDFLKQFEKRN